MLNAEQIGRCIRKTNIFASLAKQIQTKSIFLSFKFIQKLDFLHIKTSKICDFWTHYNIVPVLTRWFGYATEWRKNALMQTESTLESLIHNAHIENVSERVRVYFCLFINDGDLNDEQRNRIKSSSYSISRSSSSSKSNNKLTNKYKVAYVLFAIYHSSARSLCFAHTHRLFACDARSSSDLTISLYSIVWLLLFVVFLPHTNAACRMKNQHTAQFVHVLIIFMQFMCYLPPNTDIGNGILIQ